MIQNHFDLATFLKAFSKSFGSSEAPTSFAISTKRLWRSESVSLVLVLVAGVRGINLPPMRAAALWFRQLLGQFVNPLFCGYGLFRILPMIFFHEMKVVHSLLQIGLQALFWSQFRHGGLIAANR